MEKFSVITEKEDSTSAYHYKALVTVTGTVEASSEGDAGYLADDEVGTVPGYVSHMIEYIGSEEPVLDSHTIVSESFLPNDKQKDIDRFHDFERDVKHAFLSHYNKTDSPATPDLYREKLKVLLSRAENGNEEELLK